MGGRPAISGDVTISCVERPEDQHQERDRGPLLILSGERDHTVPSAVRASYKKQRANPGVTRNWPEMKGRGHSLTIDSGWREVADTALTFLARFSRVRSRTGESARMATMADLDALAMAMPLVTKEVSDDGRPSYHVHGKLFCFHRSRRPDAIDTATGERLDDVLMFRVAAGTKKELQLGSRPDVFFTTPHFNGYPAVLTPDPAARAARS